MKKTDCKDAQRKSRAALLPRLLAGYRFNSSANRARRRLNQPEFRKFFGESVQTVVKEAGDGQ